MCSEITHSKLLPYLLGANDLNNLTSVYGEWIIRALSAIIMSKQSKQNVHYVADITKFKIFGLLQVILMNSRVL